MRWVVSNASLFTRVHDRNSRGETSNEPKLKLSLPSQIPRPGCFVAVLALSVVAVALESGADTIIVPNTFTDGTTASADEVNANYDVIVVESNNQDVRISDAEEELSGLGSCNLADQRVYHDGSTLRCYSPSMQESVAHRHCIYTRGGVTQYKFDRHSALPSGRTAVRPGLSPGRRDRQSYVLRRE